MPTLCQCGFNSESLGKSVSVNVIVPQSAFANDGVGIDAAQRRYYPVLYLLHGRGDDHSIWCRRTALELYSAEHECIIVMPDGGRSFYRNMASSARYKDFISKELINFIEGNFPAISDRKSRFICGLSMGGYGAMAIGFEFPELYSKIGAFSSVADIRYFAENHITQVERKSIFGDEISGADDLFELSAAAVKSVVRPELFLACGTGDFLYDSNTRFRKHLDNIGYPYTYVEKEDVHNWYFWDEQIRNALKFFMKK